MLNIPSYLKQCLMMSHHMAAAPTPNIQRQFTYHRSLTAFFFLQILQKIETVTAA